MNDIEIWEQEITEKYQFEEDFRNTCFEICQVLNEAFYSKTQLQDPKTAEKIIQKINQQPSFIHKINIITDTIVVIISIISGVATGMPVVGIGAFLGLIALSIKLVRNMDDHLAIVYRKDMMDLRDKAAKLRDVSREKGQTEMANKADSVVKTIDNYYSDRHRQDYEKHLDSMCNDYKYLLGLLDGTKSIEEPKLYWVTLAKALKIPFNQIENSQKKHGGFEQNILQVIYGVKKPKDVDDPKGRYKDLCKICPEAKTGDNVRIYYLIDDTILFYSNKANKWIYGDPADRSFTSFASLESLIRYADPNGIDKLEDYDIELLKAADIKLKQYRITKPDTIKEEVEIFDW